MKLHRKIFSISLISAAIVVSSNSANATNGYFTHGVGAKSKSLAGSGIGSDANMGSIQSASNPALGVFAGEKWEVGLAIFSPRRSYEASASQINGQSGAFTIGAGEFDSDSEYFPIPYVAKNWWLDNKRALSVVFYGRGGMNTDWKQGSPTATFDPDGPGPTPVSTLPGTFGGGDAGVDLSQAFLSVNYAGLSGDRFAWGFGPIVAVQAFEATGVAAFAGFTSTFASSGGTTLPTSLSDNGHEFSFGIGVSLGGWLKLSDAVSLGASYQSRIVMSEFEDYEDLFAEQGGFDIPSSFRAGLSLRATDAVRLNLDVEHTLFSEVDSVGNELGRIISCPTAGQGGTDVQSCLGGDNGAGFSWNDVTSYKLGVEWQMDSNWIVRAGASTAEQPVPDNAVLFNILAPGVIEQHYTFGLTRKRANGGDWTLALMYAPEKKVKGTNLFDPTQTIELKMDQFEIEVSTTW